MKHQRANFLEPHINFNESYTDLAVKIDEIAERIPTLGHRPEQNYSSYTKTSKITESAEIPDGLLAATGALNSFQTIITLRRELLELSSDVGERWH